MTAPSTVSPSASGSVSGRGTLVARMLFLVVVWLALWSEVSVANVLSGVIVAGAVVGLFSTWREGPVVIRPVATLRFLLLFTVMLVRSTWAVALTVLAPGRRTHPAIVAMPLTGCSDAVVTVVANAVTLTPGTLTLEVRRQPTVLFIHVLDGRDLSAVRRDLRRLEVAAVGAFGDRAALDHLETDDTEIWEAS